MIIRKNFKYLLKPNKTSEALFHQFAGARRWIYNWGLQQRKETFEKEEKKVSLFDQNNALVFLKQKTTWLSSIHSQVLQQALSDLDKAYGSFFLGLKKGPKVGYPRFKCKGVRDSFRYPQGVKVEEDRVFLPKIGWVKWIKSREIEGVIKQTTILKEGEKWYISFSCEIENFSSPKIDLNPKKSVGIDLGLTHFATMAIGDKNHLVTIENPKFLKKSLDKLRFLSRNLSRKMKKGKNRYKARKKLSQFHFHLRNLRLDFCNKLVLQIVKNHDIIGIEKMNILHMVQGLKTLARAINDAGWGLFLSCLKNKAIEYGKTLHEVSSFLGNTKLCSNCGQKNEMELGQRTYKCSCGHNLDRDLNAAINIKNQAVGASV